MLKTVKFGGSSLADAEQFKKAAAIVRDDLTRRYVVVSAPGKRNKSDEKITDLLIQCQKMASAGNDYSRPFQTVRDRFFGICRDLGLKTDLEKEFSEIADRLSRGATPDYVASRGEYLNGLLMADLLGFSFVDPKDGIVFDPSRRLDEKKTDEKLSELLRKYPRAVIPGFYGADESGEIVTFSRGGSDITGSLVARAVKADLYENWTDVSGLLMADPRLVENPKPISTVTYQELRELSYMGASVLHEEATFPVSSAKIPINIRNTNRPEDPGTMILPSAPSASGNITGIAGRKGFSAVYLEKDRMNSEIGFVRKVLQVFENYGISIEHLPSGIDAISVVAQTKEMEGKVDRIFVDLQEAVQPNRIALFEKLAIIAVVGRGMIRAQGTASKIFHALSKEEINIRMIDQGSSELNIIVGIEEKDYERAVRAVYAAFITEE